MKRLITLGAVVLGLGLTGVAQAQAGAPPANQPMMPSGGMHPDHPMMPGDNMHREDMHRSDSMNRPDDSRTVMHHETRTVRETRVTRHSDGMRKHRVCRAHWSHGHRVRVCKTHWH